MHPIVLPHLTLLGLCLCKEVVQAWQAVVLVYASRHVTA